MYITHLEVQNYRGISNLALDFHEGANLLIGNNGAGKTSLLHSISILASQPIRMLTGVRGMEITGHDAYSTTVLVGDAVSQNIAHYPICIQGNICYQGKDFYCHQEKKSDAGTLETNNWDLAMQFKNDQAETGKAFPLLCYIQAGRETAGKPVRITMPNKEPQRTDGYKDAFAEHLNFQAIQQWCLQMDFAEYQRKHEIKEYRTFKEIIARFFGLLDPQRKNDRVYYSSLMSSLVCFDGETEKTIYQMSDGYQAALCLIIELAYRAVVLNPMDEEIANHIAGIVMIDEIEMHLHPAWQWNILRALTETFPRIQFFISTHSPIVLSSANHANIYLMKTPTDVISVDNVYGYQINDVLKYLQGSEYQPETVSRYYEEIDRLLENGTDGDLKRLMDQARAAFGNAPQVIKELQDYIDVNHWVEEA